MLERLNTFFPDEYARPSVNLDSDQAGSVIVIIDNLNRQMGASGLSASAIPKRLIPPN